MKFLITEIQNVISERIVEADTEEEALDAFWEGEGTPTKNNGEVTGSTLLGAFEITA